MRRLLHLVMLVLLCVALVPSPKLVQSAPLAAPVDSAFGVGSYLASRYANPSTLNAAVDLLAQSGAGWVREDFPWENVEPQPGQYNWGFFDSVVDTLAQHGISVMGVLTGPTPAWAVAGTPSGPFSAPDPQRFAEFAAAAAQHFGNRLGFWQIWNEPDNRNYWQPGPDATAYANLLKDAYPAIKAANPNAQVMLGGIVPFDLGFPRAIHDNGAWNSFDIISVHPYIDPASPEDGQIGIAGIGAIKALAEGFGKKPIWATEYGWATGPSDRVPGGGTDEETQANYLVRSMALLRAAGADKVLWYSFKDANGNPYGLLRTGNSPTDYSQQKPSFVAFKTLNQQLSGTTKAELQDLGNRQVIINFESFGTWRRGDQPNGVLTQSRDQHHEGNASAKLHYTFSASENNYVVFRPSPAIDIPGNPPSRLGIWVNGDGSAHTLKIWLRDAHGEVQFRLGYVGKDWQFLSTSIVGQGDIINGSGKRNVDFSSPVKLSAIVLDAEPDSFTGEGDIYLDDVTVISGPDAYDVRFDKGNGNVVDVIWAPQAGRVVIPTSSSQGNTLVDRQGAPQSPSPNNGVFTFDAGASPLYLSHKPPSSSPIPVPVPVPTPNPSPGTPGTPIDPDTARCAARCASIVQSGAGIALATYCPECSTLLGVGSLVTGLASCTDKICIARTSAKYIGGAIADELRIGTLVKAAFLADTIERTITDPTMCVGLKEWVNNWTREANSRRIPLKGIVTQSPVYTLITNKDGLRAGFLPDGQVVQEIPYSRVGMVGEQRFILAPGQDDFALTVTGYDQGTMNLYATFAQAGSLGAATRTRNIYTVSNQAGSAGITLSYENVPITRGMKATLISTDPNHTLAIDLNGDGQVDQNRSPDNVEFIPFSAPAPSPSDGSFAADAFHSVWERTDKPVASGAPRLQPRSWIWGPQPLTAGTREPYAEGSGGTRLVQYFDKSRMEINHPDAPRGPGYVTNGLLVVEMIEGRVQIGDTTFENRMPADEAVAGDPAGGNPNAPTYRSFRSVAFPVNPQKATKRIGDVVIDVLAKDGSVSQNPDVARYNVKIDAYDEQLGHNIPKVFTTFFAQQGVVYEGGRYIRKSVIDWLFVMGLPISEPYWARVKVGGVEKDVLMQAFQRRVLTYTPGNPPGFEVEMGNVGQHYLRWRYGS